MPEMYYTDIKIDREVEGDGLDIVTLIAQAVHSNNSHTLHKIAIDFPEMARFESSNPFGYHVRLFSLDWRTLEDFRSVRVVKALSDACSITLSSTATPPETDNFRVIRRIRNDAKTEAGVSQRIKRDIARGYTDVARRRKPENAGNLPYLKIRSSTTGQAFSIFIGVENMTGSLSSGDIANINSYGLSPERTSHFFAIPAF